MIDRSVLDEKIFYWLNSFAGNDFYLDFFFIFLAECLIYIMIIFFSLYFLNLALQDKKIELKEIFLYFSAPIIAWIVVKKIKYFFPTDRPYQYLEGVVKLIDESSVASFPSGHTIVVFAMAMSIYFYNKKIGIIFFVLAALVSISRIFVGVHFPLDIIAGIFLGVLVSIVFKFSWEKFKKK